ncbi:P-loop containing nucleoside triphosphate hydrolase protein, partial [Aureobasidium melanogenum]
MFSRSTLLICWEGVSDKYRHRVFVSATSSTTLLTEVGDRVGESASHDRIEGSDINAQFQCTCCNDTDEFALEHFLFDLSTILGSVSASIGHDSCHDLRFVKDELTEELRSFRQSVTSARSRKASHRNLICDSGRTRDELDMAVSHSGTDSAQASHDQSYVCSEKSVVDVQLIHNYEAQILKEGSPGFFLWQDSNVQHIRIGEDDAAFISNEIAIAHLCVSIKGFDNEILQSVHLSPDCSSLTHVEQIVDGLGLMRVQSSNTTSVVQCIDKMYHSKVLISDTISGMVLRSSGIDFGSSALRFSGVGVFPLLSDGAGMFKLCSTSSFSTGSTPSASHSFSQAFTAEVNLLFLFSIRFIICFWL